MYHAEEAEAREDGSAAPAELLRCGTEVPAPGATLYPAVRGLCLLRSSVPYSPTPLFDNPLTCGRSHIS